MTTPTRPDFIDVRSESQASIPRPLKSPRLHVAGEHPPELSPLDAFALQSRLLAKQLEVAFGSLMVCHVLGDLGLFVKAGHDIINENVFRTINIGGSGS